jgi:glycosyltransferase involved in cell wall biosynthesis
MGHEIETFPPMKDSPRINNNNGQKNDKNLIYYIKKVNLETLLYFLHQSNGYISEWVMLMEGLVGSCKNHRALKTLVVKFEPDVIIYRYEAFNFAPYWASAAYGIPLLGEINSLRSMEARLWDTRNKVTFVTRSCERKSIRSFDSLFCVSEAVQEVVDHHVGPSKSCVIPNGVDTGKFDPGRYDKERSKAKLNVSGKTVLGYVGAYKSWHGLETSLEVIERLSKHDESFHLLLIGCGDEYARIGRLVAEKQLTAFVTQTGQVSHQMIPEYIAAFDYALMTYPEMEPFHFSPLKMFEYMAMGVPVISTDIGQIGRIITHGSTGILVSPPTADNFVRGVFQARDRIVEIGDNARKLMMDQYSWRANGERILEICEQLRTADNPNHSLGKFK